MFVGVNAHHHHLPHVEALGLQAIRQEMGPGSPEEDLRAAFRAYQDSPVELLAMLNGQATDLDNFLLHVRWVMTVAKEEGYRIPGLELGNEPDLQKFSPRYWRNPEGWATTCRRVADVLRGDLQYHGVIAVGSVSNLNDRGLLTYLTRMVETGLLTTDLAIAVHRYPHHLDPRLPQRGFHSRSSEWSYLHGLVGDRQILVTEVGYHTWPETWTDWRPPFRHQRQLSDGQAADALEWELDFFGAKGATGAYLYQLVDGPPPSDHYEWRFGLLTHDLQPKPQSRRVEAWIARQEAYAVPRAEVG